MHKRILSSSIVSVIIFLCTYFPVSADSSGNIPVIVNNKAVAFSAATAYYNGTLLVPAKEYVQALGGKFTYNSDTMTGTAAVGESEIVFKLDNKVACFDGKYVQAPAPFKILSNRFMIPAAFTAEKLDAASFMSAYRNIFMVFQPVGGKLVYSVLPGDTLWIISQLFGTTISSLKQMNGLTGDMILIGQKLAVKYFVPTSTVLPAYTTAGATIRSGAGFGSGVAGYLGSWVNINVTGKVGGWFKVTTPKGKGYIYYTVVGMKQELASGAKSSYFDSVIPVDTSMDTTTYKNYTVVKGEYIWLISQKFGIPDYELAAANSISASADLYPGQVIRIPVHNIAVKTRPGPQYGEVLDWFKEAQYVFPIGKTGKLTDIATGKSFMVKRTMGANHSDTETLTAQDTQIMKEIFGGAWTWNRRAFIFDTDGRRISVSVAGMPHAGVDGVPFLQNTDNRSGDYGYGPNDDSISGNGMDGHFDMYFLNSLRHADNTLDPVHQYLVLTAGGLQ